LPRFLVQYTDFFISLLTINCYLFVQQSHQNTSNITINGTLDGVAGNTWKNSLNASLYYNNATEPMANGNLDVAEVPNTVYYSSTGEQGIKATAYYNIVCTPIKANTLTTPSLLQANQDFKIQQTGKLVSQQELIINN
jgi:hypothetical protein